LKLYLDQPNPELTDFVQRHLEEKPYIEEEDIYEVEPFARDITEGKNDPIYNAHSYHTKVPPKAIEPYILHYTKPGDLILDPFCGSGMTGVSALRTGRKAILIELSPAAVFIAYNYCTPVDP
jgi:DNA modification methylase